MIEANATGGHQAHHRADDEYALYLWLSQCDDKLPMVYMGDGHSLIIDISQLMKDSQ